MTNNKKLGWFLLVVGVVGGSLLFYRYVYLSTCSGLGVMVSATNRITGNQGVFGSPCNVPFWYADIKDYNSDTRSMRQQTVRELGAQVMPFSLDKTLHTFKKNELGGTQTVVVRDVADKENLPLIRTHLIKEAENFKSGVFVDPTEIHGENMPGVSVLTKNYKKIKITYRELSNGALINFESSDPETVVAIHAWFDAQVGDHGKDAIMMHK